MRTRLERLQDILGAILHIESEAAQGREAFYADPKSHVWMIHHIMIIGEAASAIVEHLQREAPATDWRAIIGMRHVLVHGYFGIDLDTVWEVVRTDLPVVRKVIEELIAKELISE